MAHLSASQEKELRRQARAVLRGWRVPPGSGYDDLVAAGFISNESNQILTPAGWKAVTPLLDEHDAETAGYLASGGFRLRFNR